MFSLIHLYSAPSELKNYLLIYPQLALGDIHIRLFQSLAADYLRINPYVDIYRDGECGSVDLIFIITLRLTPMPSGVVYRHSVIITMIDETLWCLPGD
jgi:hypothetical protein